METIIKPIKITKANFATYGDLISSDDVKPMNINDGYAKRFNNLANINTSNLELGFEVRDKVLELIQKKKKYYSMRIIGYIIAIIAVILYFTKYSN